jgi:hypothetical protein
VQEEEGLVVAREGGGEHGAQWAVQVVPGLAFAHEEDKEEAVAVVMVMVHTTVWLTFGCEGQSTLYLIKEK